MILQKAIPYLSQMTLQEQTKLILWYFFFTFLIIFLFLLVIFLRHYFKHRRRRSNSFMIDLTSLEKMQRTGLLSDDEIKRTKEILKKYIVETIDKEKESKPPLSPVQPDKLTAKKFKPSIPEVNAESKKPEPETAPLQKTAKKKPEQRPIDVEDLYRKGVITEEEYNKLCEFFKKKKKS
ncbi:hypothetical protein J7M23_13030 [Candidatus Sumerlaeota bacterium]|nr:hypothetical protein [Candidatus Sumerlaeota bacterium]